MSTDQQVWKRLDIAAWSPTSKCSEPSALQWSQITDHTGTSVLVPDSVQSFSDSKAELLVRMADTGTDWKTPDEHRCSLIGALHAIGNDMSDIKAAPSATLDTAVDMLDEEIRKHGWSDDRLEPFLNRTAIPDFSRDQGGSESVVQRLEGFLAENTQFGDIMFKSTIQVLADLSTCADENGMWEGLRLPNADEIGVFREIASVDLAEDQRMFVSALRKLEECGNDVAAGAQAVAKWARGDPDVSLKSYRESGNACIEPSLLCNSAGMEVIT